MFTYRLPFRLVCLAALVAAFGLTEASAQQQDAPDSGGPDTTQPDQPSGDASSEQLLNEAAEIARQVADIRGLSLKQEIDKGIRDREELRQVLIDRLAEEVSDEEVENEAKVFKKLGLMPQQLDYKQTLLDVLTEQIAGFYDQDAKELYIMEGIPLELQRPAMAHEIFHAIQDQHFDIKRMVEPISSKENGDFALARSALIEGDASLVMIDFSLYEQGVLPREGVRSVVDIPMMANVLQQLTREDVGALQQMVPQNGDQGTDQGASPIDPSELSESALSDAPRVVRKLLVFPYFGGMRFVIDARAGSSWERVNEIYERAPVSTEQILHPQRYFARDTPVRLAFEPAPALEDASLIYDSVFGEYQMRLVLEEHLLEDEDGAEEQALIDRAMMGWDGDRLQAFELADGQVVLNHLSVWDTREDADEYFEGLVEVMKRRFPAASVSQNSGRYGQSLCLVTDEGDERVYLEQWGDLVLHIEGAPSARDEQGRETDPTAYMLREQIMQTVERTPFDQVYRERLEAYDESAQAPSRPETPAGAPPAQEPAR